MTPRPRTDPVARRAELASAAATVEEALVPPTPALDVTPIVVQDGSPGIYGDSPVDIYYDNVTVKVNE